MIQVYIGDFETASACDLKKCGAWRYSEDPTTDVLTFSFGRDRDHIETWTPWMNAAHPMTIKLKSLADDPEVQFVAHNAGFEKAIWRNIMVPFYGFPNIPNSRWHDTMAVAAMKQVPLQLERLVQVLRLPEAKDMEGNKLTLGLSKINKKTGNFPERTLETIHRVAVYCETDCRNELDVLDRIGFLPPGERNVWLLDQRINERGVRLDLPFVRAAQSVVDRASAPLMKEFSQITGGLTINQPKFKDWCHVNGVRIPNLQKETIARYLGGDIDGVEEDSNSDNDVGAIELELPPQVRRALSIRQLIGSASVKKLGRMAACACADERARGLLQYHGAGPGRWAGRIIQPQNFPRGTLKIANEEGKKISIPPQMLVDAVMAGDIQYIENMLGPAVETIVGGLRHAIIAAADRELCVGDFSTIEARIVLALAGQMDKVSLIASGLDIYNDMATTIYHRPIDRKNPAMAAEGQVGKNSVLGLGFQMGWKKFQFKYAPKESDDFCQEVVRVYRKEWAPKVPDLWWALERAAVQAVWTKRPQEAYGVEYRLEDGWLTARLPSGRKLWYYNPQPVRRAMPWDEDDIRQGFTYQALKMGVWRTIDAYGGLLTENVVQALARDLMVCAMFKCEKNGLPVILTVHDEILTEPLRADADHEALRQIMVDRPAWASAIQIPMAAECWQGDRYRK